MLRKHEVRAPSSGPVTGRERASGLGVASATAGSELVGQRRRVERVARPATPPGAGRQDWNKYLSVLRRRLRATGVRPGQRHHPRRRRSTQSDQPGNAVSERCRDDRLAAQSGSVDHGQVPRRILGSLGRATPRLGHGTHRPARQTDPRRNVRPTIARRHDGQPHRRTGRVGRRHAGQRRKLPDQEVMQWRAGHGLYREPGPHRT